MTDIPGTSDPSDIQLKPKEESQLISVVNVKEIKKGSPPKDVQEEAWYEKLWFWLLVGSAGGVVFIFLGLIKRQFLALAILGPIFGFVAWGITKFFKKYAKKIDVIAK